MKWMNYRWLYLLISGILIISGIFGIIRWGFKFGVDFTGGVVAEYKMPSGEARVLRFKNLSTDEAEKIRAEYKAQNATEVRFDYVGPAIGPELIKKTLTALIVSAVLILLWVAYQFKSIKYGISATIATIHDSFILLGSFAIFGHFFGAEVDFLFVTAMLTILSFSVHDTIVVFDRIRENLRRTTGLPFPQVVNDSILQTLVRSLNTSLTTILVLFTLLIFGGESIRWFVVALLVGIISGTYSSIFNAAPLLVLWEELSAKRRSKK